MYSQEVKNPPPAPSCTPTSIAEEIIGSVPEMSYRDFIMEINNIIQTRLEGLFKEAASNAEERRNILDNFTGNNRPVQTASIPRR